MLLNPGAGWGAKQWPAERYGQVAKQLAAGWVKSVINVGPGEEDTARAVQAASGGGAETFTGSLTQLIALTRRARLFIGGDTGPMHLAAALSIPVVGIFGPTNPARNGPFGTRNIVLRSDFQLNQLQTCGSRRKPALLEISPEQVVGAASATAEGAPWLAGPPLHAGFGFHWDLLLPCFIFGWRNLLVQSILLGAALVIPGLVIRALASGHLQKNEQLATGGPYAYIRNPLYLGSLILSVGFALAARSWWIVAGIVHSLLCDLSAGDSLRGNISERALSGV